MLGTVRPSRYRSAARVSRGLPARTSGSQTQSPTGRIGLEEVALVDVAAVRFLSACEADHHEPKEHP
jgi:hypothetical protein